MPDPALHSKPLSLGKSQSSASSASSAVKNRIQIKPRTLGTQRGIEVSRGDMNCRSQPYLAINRCRPCTRPCK
jgi:hypothetical protein